MKGSTNHRRVLHFAVTGALLGGAVGCTGNEAPKSDAKAETKTKTETKTDPKPDDVKTVNEGPVKEDPVREFAPNPGPNELEPKDGPIVAPTTAVKPEPGPAPELHVNEGPVEPPELIEEHVNEGPVKPPEKAPPLKVNPGHEG